MRRTHRTLTLSLYIYIERESEAQLCSLWEPYLRLHIYIYKARKGPKIKPYRIPIRLRLTLYDESSKARQKYHKYGFTADILFIE